MGDPCIPDGGVPVPLMGRSLHPLLGGLPMGGSLYPLGSGSLYPVKGGSLYPRLRVCHFIPEQWNR